MAKTFPLHVPILAIDRFSAPIAKMGGQLGAFGSRLRNAGRTATLGLTLPLIGVAAATLTTGVRLAQYGNEVQASTDATREQRAALQAQNETLAGVTHTLTEAASVQALLAGEGRSVNRILAEQKGILQLARAGGLELAETVKLVSNAYDALGISIEGIPNAVDVLAAAGQQTNLGNLLLALRGAGATVAAAGQDFEGTVAIFDALADAGFEGERGSTALRQALARLIRPGAEVRAVLAGLRLPPSVLRDAGGGVVQLADFLDILAERGATATHAFRLFGEEGGPAIAALLAQGTRGIRAQQAALEASEGAAERISRTLSADGADAAVKFATAVERVSIALVESGLLDLLTEGVDILAGLAKRFRDLPPETRKTILVIGGFAAVAGPAIVIVGSLVGAISALIAAGTALAPVIAAVSLPVLGVAAAIGALIAIGWKLYRHWDEVESLAVYVWSSIKDAAGDALGFVQRQIDSVVGLFPDWLVRFLQGDDSAGRIAKLDLDVQGRPIGGSRDAAVAAASSQASVGGRIAVDFRNVPRGTRVEAESEGDVGLDLGLGYNLQGAL